PIGNRVLRNIARALDRFRELQSLCYGEATRPGESPLADHVTTRSRSKSPKTPYNYGMSAEIRAPQGFRAKTEPFRPRLVPQNPGGSASTRVAQAPRPAAPDAL